MKWEWRHRKKRRYIFGVYWEFLMPPNEGGHVDYWIFVEIPR